MSKATFAMYWAASCGGCEISLLNIGNDILAVDEAFEVLFWPCIADFKYHDVEQYADGAIDLCLFNGAIRNSENEELARLLRRKSKILVAFGSCASEGCIPGLANLTSSSAIFNAAYADCLTTDGSRTQLPQMVTLVPEGEIRIPRFYETVRTLDQVVPVDYVIPGCPPEAHQIAAVIKAIISGAPLPAPGRTVIGASKTAVCEECPLTKDVKQITRFYRPYELIPDPTICLLEQGLLCMGPATRGGCGALCPQVGMRCEGCYGPLEGQDQGARMLSAVASVVAVGKPGDEEAALEAAIDNVMATLVDPAGTFYRFSLARSLLQRSRVTDPAQQSAEEAR
ncbi:oxidoreductase [Candidatus Chloroploca sp. Khr17]|uniref:NADH-quinone oxidoreductase subunit B family protein n=1 Tax=Candidatus Chloroploca sp. Khr17 TaxID=2496869 RepID=UPI00101C31F2|nr:oxidoreductase [Candidatus Chloroploca sp. Khr17]